MRKLLPLFLLTSLLGGLGAASASPASQISIPPQSELERYIWEVPTVSNVPSLHTTGLRDELEAEISAFLSEGRRAPWFFVNGKGSAVFYFLEPTQTMYYLALAYPYLSPALQTQVESFVGSELASYDLLGAYSRYDWAEGLTYINGAVQADPARRRETSPPGPFWYCTIAGGCEGKGGGSSYITPRKPFDRLYDIWFYAYRTGDWNYVESEWDTIKGTRGIITDVNDDAILLGLASMDADQTATWDSANRRLSALIAYARMADHMNDTAEVAWAVDAATRAMQARLRYINNNRPTPWDGTSDSPCSSTWEANCTSVGGLFIVRRGGHSTNIPEYKEMTADVGRLLAEYASSEFSQYDTYVDVIKPAAYLQSGANNMGGEVPYVFPHNVQGVFLAKALVTRLPGDQLRKYVDVPWIEQDYYYWERLARAVDAYGTLCLEDVRTLAIECPLGVASATKSVNSRVPGTGEVVTYTITLVGSDLPITVTDQIPPGLEYRPGSVSNGSYNPTLGQVEHSSTLTAGHVLKVTFGVTVTEEQTKTIVNTATVQIGADETLYPSASIFVNGRSLFLPVLLKSY